MTEPTKRKPGRIILLFLLGLMLIQSYAPVVFITNLLVVLDAYLRLVLTSWPAVILILAILLPSSSREAILDFLKKKLL